ncbi:putative O-methyltransferase [Halenospora varia]|nr:putative O-methyltransferase [Halenospora varia]
MTNTTLPSQGNPDDQPPEHFSKDLVRSGYDTIAPTYLAWTFNFPSPREAWTHKLLSLLSPQSNSISNQVPLPTTAKPKILELGCGAGLPCTKLLAENADVTANDISSVQLALAAKNVPGVQYIHSDMDSLSFPPSTFHAVAAFYSIIHLPRSEQSPLLSRVHGWLKPGGYLLVNLGVRDDEEIFGENWLGVGEGKKMYWSGWDEEGNRGMVERCGFEILEAKVVEQQEEVDKIVPFLWVLGRKGGE